MCVSVCLSVTMITKHLVDGFVPNFMGRFLGGKERPSSCFVTIVEVMVTMYHCIKRLEIATISSSGSSLVGRTTGRECSYECC